MCRKLIYITTLCLVISLVTISSGDDLDSNLMGWWTFDGHALDISGNNRHGTLQGSPQYVPGVFGEALEFQSNPDYVTIDGYKGVLGTSAFSITAWIKTTNTATQQIIHWGAHVNEQRVEFRIQANRLRISHGAGNVQGNTDLIDDQWHHIAAVVIENATASSGDVTFYVDGEVDTMESTDPEGWNIVANDTLDVTIGWRPTQQDRPFIGTIDDVRIYNKVLTQEEIQQIMISGGEPYPFASSPNPADGALHESTWVNLTWAPGALALSHDVYFGDNFDDVNNGTGDTFIGNQTAASLILGFPGFPLPDGLVTGTTYYWRIDEVNDSDPNSPWKGTVWTFTVPSMTAYNASPADGAKYIDPDVTLSWTAGLSAKVHYVYFGDNFDDVNSAAAGMSQAETTYNPGTLEMDKSYYWRVDEFDGITTHKGQVMSFSTMPVIEITDPNLIGWWKLDAGAGTIAPDWSGHGNHGLIIEPQWLIPGWIGESALSFSTGKYVAIRNLVMNDPNQTEVTVAAWVQTSESVMQTIVSFDRSEYWRFESGDSQYAGPGKVGWEVSTSTGVVDLASQKLIDDGQWHHVAGVFDNGLMTIYIDGQPDITATGGSTFGTGETRYGFIASQSEATAFDGDRSGSPGHWLGSIDDVRIYDKALTQDDIAQVTRGDLLLAWDLQPPSGIYDLETVPSSLSWKPGDMAAEHDVYFGKDQQSVQTADASDTTNVYRGRQTGTTYVPPEGFAWDQTYYWRIDELNTDGTITKGQVRAIIIADFISIDDFESYNDLDPDDTQSNRIFNTWLDGYDDPTNGSIVGYGVAPFTEQTIVHGGQQSMPLFYDNAVGKSEATLALTGLRDWTKHNIGQLSLWFIGNPAGFIEEDGTFTINAAGADIWDMEDEFRFVYKQLSGPGSIVAKVLSVENTSNWAKAGVMIRESLDPDSKHAFMCITPNNGVAAQARVTNGTTSVRNNQTGISAPHWVKLERDAIGNLTASHSADGISFQPIEGDSPRLISMSEKVYIGLAVTSANAGAICTAEFANVQTTGTVTPMTWSDQAIGTTMLTNNLEPMYVVLNDSAVATHENPNAALVEEWTEWKIDLSLFADQGVNLNNVNSITIGFGDRNNPVAGGSGTVFFDDLRLLRPLAKPESEPAP